MTKNIQKYSYKKQKRHLRKIVGTLEKPRLAIYKSNKHIYSQLINDINGLTLCSSSTVEKEISKKIPAQKLSLSLSYTIGENLGIRAKKKNILRIAFDRNYQLYHGKIKNLVQGIRDQGIIC